MQITGIQCDPCIMDMLRPPECVTYFVLLQPGASSPVLDHIKNVENTLGVTPHKQSIAAILQPGGKLKVQIGFQPRDDLARSSLILIR